MPLVCEDENKARVIQWSFGNEAGHAGVVGELSDLRAVASTCRRLPNA